MSDITFYTCCLTSAIFYSLAGIFIKKAMQGGIGIARATVAMTTVLVVVFSPLLLLTECALSVNNLWKPIITGFVSFLGTISTIVAIQRGDITIQTPMMGIKIIFVAFISMVMGVDDISFWWWMAAVLACISIFILGWSGINNPRSLVFTVCFALIASLFYAIEDVMIQKWAPHYGPYWYIFILMVSQMIFSFSLIPLFYRYHYKSIMTSSWIWLIIGMFLMGIQGILFYIPISLRGEATVVNILYSSRGLWSIVLIWFFGDLIGNEEKHIDNKIMIQRLIGSLLLLISIIIALVA